MRPVVLDTSVYISALRSYGDDMMKLRRIASGAPVWLSAVVLEELYAGATGGSVRAVDKLERDFERARRILVPNSNDWALAGRVLARLASELGYQHIGRARLTNDALIAMSAARTGMTIITTNEKDFASLAKFRAFSWHVRNS
jgi:predicted nucleic acid-binding protein